MGKESGKMYQEEFSGAFDLFYAASQEGQDFFPEWLVTFKFC